MAESPEPFSQAASACERGDVDSLARLLADNPGLTTAREPGGDKPSGHTLLHIATCCHTMAPPINAGAVMRLLIDNGADIEAQNNATERGERPLHWAASVGRADLCEILLDAGAEIDPLGAVLADGTPCFEAVCFGMVEAAHLLVRRGAAVNIDIAAALGMLERVRTFFDEDGKLLPTAFDLPGRPVEIESEDPLKFPLHNAAFHGHSGTVAFLLERGANPSFLPPWDDNTALDHARDRGHKAVIAMLEAAGAKTGDQMRAESNPAEG